MPTGRPLPTLQQIRQANLRKIFEEEGAEAPCDICGDPTHDYRKCSKEAYRESQDVRQDMGMVQGSEGQCPNCDQTHPGIYVHVPSVTNWATLPKTVWLISLMIV